MCDFSPEIQICLPRLSYLAPRTYCDQLAGMDEVAPEYDVVVLGTGTARLPVDLKQLEHLTMA